MTTSLREVVDRLPVAERKAIARRSRIEQRGDLLLSTPRDYVQPLGGELELLCTFKNRGFVRIRTGKVSRLA
ncbi:MAG: hypothetical protein KF822_05820 [Steroidobacteraceae bacterium]|nr:hypothetical protein [Steroidobacteraceae bacterium]